MNANMFKCALVLCFCALLGKSQASAIPMWEFLSRQEKMSFLYSLFANQVEAYCDSSAMANCNQKLLRYGLNSLKRMSEEVLDATDPYQRDSNNIIWETLMKGHYLAVTTPKPQVSSSTAKPNSYDDDESFGDESYGDFGSESAASASIDNVYRVPPPKDYVLQLESGTPEYISYPHNVATFLESVNGPVEDKGAYDRFREQHSSSSTTERIPEIPLTGPVEVKVYLDGTPVDEKLPIHHDEDLRQYKLSKMPIPNL